MARAKAIIEEGKAATPEGEISARLGLGPGLV